jgi:hypothetical protein
MHRYIPHYIPLLLLIDALHFRAGDSALQRHRDHAPRFSDLTFPVSGKLCFPVAASPSAHHSWNCERLEAEKSVLRSRALKSPRASLRAASPRDRGDLGLREAAA